MTCSLRQPDRPDHARGAAQRARIDRRRDGGGAEAHLVLAQHQGAHGRLLRDFRRRGAARRAGRARAGASRLDAAGGERDGRRGRARSTRAMSSSSTTRSPAARTCPTSRSSRRCMSTGRHHRLCRDAGASRRCRRHGAGLDARQEPRDLPGRASSSRRCKLYRRGELQDDVLRLILANVRTPTERRGDLNAQLAALRVGAAAPRRAGAALRRAIW